MKGGAGGIFRDGDFFELRIVRLQKAFALAVHANPAGNQVRLAGLNVTIALDAGQAAGAFEFAQDALEFLLGLRRQMEGAEQLGNVQRHVIRLTDESQEFGINSVHCGGLKRDSLAWRQYFKASYWRGNATKEAAFSFRRLRALGLSKRQRIPKASSEFDFNHRCL